MFKVVPILLLLVLCDFIGIRIAEHIARPKIPSELTLKVDWAQSGAQGCEIKRALIVYRYQICYNVIAWGGDEKEWRASLFYHKPRSLLHYSRIFVSTSYYFREFAYGENIRTFSFSSED